MEWYLVHSCVRPGLDSLFIFKEGPLMTEIHIFLFSFFPPNRSGNCTTEGPTPVFKCLGGREGPLMAEIYIFCFPIFFPNMSGISGYKGLEKMQIVNQNLQTANQNQF